MIFSSLNLSVMEKSVTIEQIRQTLEKLGAVQSVHEIRIEDRMIESIIFESISSGELGLRRLTADDAPALFDFYIGGLSEESRTMFPPYPLFDTLPDSAEELANRIRKWKKEDDWTVLVLEKSGYIIGIGLLKRYGTDRPTSGLAVREEYQNTGLGMLIQTVVNEQARLLGLTKLYASLAQNNTASLKVHLKSGFQQTGKLVPHYIQKKETREVDRYDIEVVREL